MAKKKLKGGIVEVRFVEELLKGSEKTDTVLMSMLENIKDSIPRREPSLVPMVNGKPVTLEVYRQALLDRYNKGVAFYSELSLKLADKKDPFRVPWADVSGLHSDLAGKTDNEDENSGLFNRILREKTAKDTVEHYDPSLSGTILNNQVALLNYFKEYTSINLAKQGISSTKTKIKLLIDRGPDKDRVLLVTYVSAPFDSKNIGGISKDPNSFVWADIVNVYHEPAKGLVAPLDIEHFKALATESAEALLNFFKKVHLNIQANKDIIINSYPTGTYNKALSFIETVIKNTEKELDELYKIDNIFVDPNIKEGLLNSEVANDLLSQLQKGPDGKYGFYMVAETSPNSGKLHLLPITVTMPEGFASGGAYGNRFWGQRSGVVLNRIIRIFAPGLADSSASNSFITSNILKSLSIIFSFDPKISNKFKEALNKNFADKHSKSLFIPVLKGKRFKLNTTVKLNVPKPKKYSANYKRQPEFTTLNILPILNAEIKRYVLEQMSYPSLVNRSGRFASSVQILSAQEDAAVRYTYQKSPYQVFSKVRGRPPWNDRDERDPAEIIDKAIKKLGMERFRKVFRTEEV